MIPDQTLRLTGPLAPMTTSRISTQARTRGIALMAFVALTACGAVPRVAAEPQGLPTGSTGSVNGSAGSEGAIDPDATNFSYPFPVRFFPAIVEHQEVRIAFMDVQPTSSPNA